MVCVVIGVVFFVHDQMTGVRGDITFRLGLSLRTLRIFRFMYVNRELRALLWCALRVGRLAIKLLWVWFLPIYIFAIIGTSTYGNRGPFVYDPLTKRMYQELAFLPGLAAALTLWECSTISGWTSIMKALNPSAWDEVYFYAFRILMTMVFVPIITGFIIESLVTAYGELSMKQMAFGDEGKQNFEAVKALVLMRRASS